MQQPQSSAALETERSSSIAGVADGAGLPRMLFCL
jgi:hypothetical protein